MLYLPSARRLLVPALSLLVLLALIRVLAPQWLPSASDTRLLKTLLQAQMQASHRVQIIVNISHGDDLFPRLRDENGHAFLSQTIPTPIPLAHPLVRRFQRCSVPLNRHTQHTRLPNILYNISLTPADQPPNHDESTRFFNPAIIPLPHWSAHAHTDGSPKYVLVSRVVTSGFHQEAHVCLADMCLPSPSPSPSPDTDPADSPGLSKRTPRHLPPDARPCLASDHAQLGSHGGMRCVTTPVKINIPPTPAESCSGAWLAFPDIPGFHDPRVFWSGKGEPLILVNSASRYGCVGLWIVDLRVLFPELDKILSRKDTGSKGMGSGRLLSYPHLTEITRNPRSSRTSIEKNWVFWFPNREEAFVQYDLLGRSVGAEHNEPRNVNQTEANHTESETGTTTYRGRTFARLTGNGFTTRNLTHRLEEACFSPSHSLDQFQNRGHWHQGSNALRLILCTRTEARQGECDEEMALEDGRSVHFAIMHRKFSNELELPLRYERYVVVWEGREPFQMLGVSEWPTLMRNERARPWTVEENWPAENEEGEPGWNKTTRMFKRGEGRKGVEEEQEGEEGSVGREAYFTYTPSLSWAWRPHSGGLGKEEEDDDDDVEHMSQLGTGYLRDEVLVGIGLDDVSQAFVRVKVEDLLQCLRLCTGVKFAHQDAE